MMDRIDLVAHRPHYFEHLLPVWRALPDARRGRLVTLDADIRRRGRAEGMDWHTRPGPFYMVAGVRDFVRHRRQRGKSRAAMFIHGTGMDWPRLDRSMWPDLDLWVLPRGDLAPDREALGTRCVSIDGSPWLDRHHGHVVDPANRTVAISFHWDCRTAPETRSALFHYRHVLPELAERFDLIGHSHPQSDIRRAARIVYDSAGIEFVPSFDEVVERARVYVIDVSSTAYEAAAVGLNVISMNLPTYRRTANVPPRFWDYVPGPQVDRPEDLGDMIQAVLDDPSIGVEDARRAVDYCYPIRDGHAAERAAAALMEWVERTES